MEDTSKRIKKSNHSKEQRKLKWFNVMVVLKGLGFESWVYY